MVLLDSVKQNPLLWTCAAGVVGLGVSLLSWKAAKAAELYVPIQYQYRPGTISGWLANALANHSKSRRKRRPVRVYLDGCFDMMHYGHANALRQAKAVGDELVVGLINDAEIMRCKGPPVMNEEERHTLVEAVKWVDEILTGVPYDLNPEFVNELFTKHRIDYIIHGDDPCLLPDGSDAYAHAKKLGRFKMVKRTEGVSTTDIVGRMLTCSRVNHFINADEPHPLAKSFSMGTPREESNAEASTSDASTRTTLSKFLPTSRRLVQFSNGRVAPEGARIVYIDGAFDCFHPGHVKILQAAKAQGDFLLVGLHTDEDVQARRGPHLPIMNLHERSLSVLSCKYVDEVVIGSPCVITEDLMTTFNISVVVRGSMSETSMLGPVEEERYEVPRRMGLFTELPSPSDVSARNIIHRIVDKRAAFEARNAKKVKGEEAYYTGAKQYVQEL
ncbi:hypothetical protein CHLRE_12g539000v5 [Chlamydomonas reinhardtii]|uniref:ethanolamine-phosphate cytidylyltransferase n=1 Tax=Chlamydomonas reinhardtii TaxID=3055 RepID=Q84JV7_CHLRE|nr:uncharacterized protein CHLRE_12g539000v5 [Chlamydomonas reinhardtii]AAO60076.1 CTP:ethanolamine cytidylyltransferase [Chlamydomonas reinhardtii]AAP21826.1 CTP-phosphoethanolamine cytidylyltransferase [Chlamydomonas reinhardtii]PNW75736.1 hypothetical protein CHLRE_12g539000v5 [Chlamydomonas reinhardtii]|eukprot:XP_001692963.1 CDP-Ethanolamine synthase [Chlamydomonas reinhardtii]